MQKASFDEKGDVFQAGSCFSINRPKIDDFFDVIESTLFSGICSNVKLIAQQLIERKNYRLQDFQNSQFYSLQS